VTPVAQAVLVPRSMARPAPFIQVEHLRKSYRGKGVTLEDTGFAVGEGEFVSLLGPSGCGKSTLLKLMAGLSPATSGTISIGGLTPAQAREAISFIFQDATLLPWRTVAGNIALALEFEGVPPAARAPRIEAVLKLVGLAEAGAYYPRQLSGGMKMRVSIARALVTTPRLVLMDEPFGALDEITRNYLNEEVLRLKQAQKWTTMFVTHSVPEAVFLSDRVLVMRSNPGGIAREVAVPFAYPRTAALRRDPAYVALVADISAVLAEAGGP
jgi:NitT/TauT family transport system ATP-binding protein